MKKKTMSGYLPAISAATGCTDQIKLKQIEEYMRQIYFHSTLDWIDAATFAKGARESMRDLVELEWRFI